MHVDLLNPKACFPWMRISLLTGLRGGDTEVKEEIVKGEELLAQMPVSVLPVNFPC